MKHKLILYGFISIIVIISVLGYNYFKKPKPEKKVIAVVTTLSHPALERARAGFIEGIRARLGSEIEIADYNAEGNVQQANLIARQITNNTQIIGVFAIASLAAQTIAKVEKIRPVVVAAVSDPEAILPDASATNLCGLTDAIDAEYQISTILDLLPDTKSISLLYSPHETNSASVVKKLAHSAQAHHLKVELVGVYEPQQITSASHSACQKSDVVLIPLDNQLAASMPSVIKATKNLNCPVIISDEVLIKHGAAIAFGVDYQKSGEQAAGLMADIIAHKKTPQQIGFINPSTLGLYVNKQVVVDKAIRINPAATTKIIMYEGEH